MTKFNFGHIKYELFMQDSGREDEYKTIYIHVGLGIEVKTGDVDLENGSIKELPKLWNRWHHPDNIRLIQNACRPRP